MDRFRNTGRTALTVILVAAAIQLVIGANADASPAERAGTLPGFVVHFDFISNQNEALTLVRNAEHLGASVINVVPPAHVWENREALGMLDAVVAEAGRLRLSILFTRIDAAYPPDKHGQRFNYLYGRILNRPGVLPDGRPTVAYFLTTAGKKHYAEWMEEETRFYGTRYGRLPNLLGINLGPFSEPFASERGGFLQFVREVNRYELTQYTPEGAALWHKWLDTHFSGIAAVNAAYGTSFHATGEVPMPTSENDKRFARPALAYFDFARTFNDWFIERYEACRSIWHQASGRSDVPFILQFSGFEAEKLAKARPGAAAFDLPGWIERADAVGLSLYTNSGYADYGAGSIRATVRLVSLASQMHKDVFVLESGCEEPNVVLNRKDLQFLAQVAMPLHPRTWIYEFLKDKFDETFTDNPGKIFTADGRLRRRAGRTIKSIFAGVRAANVSAEVPSAVAIVDEHAVREDPALASAALALFDLASRVSIAWLPPDQAQLAPPGVKQLHIASEKPQPH